MKKTNLILAIVTVVSFVAGLWQIGIAALIVLIITATSKEPEKSEEKTDPKDLQTEIERLSQEVEELKAQQFVQNIIDKTENK